MKIGSMFAKIERTLIACVVWACLWSSINNLLHKHTCPIAALPDLLSFEELQIMSNDTLVAHLQGMHPVFNELRTLTEEYPTCRGPLAVMDVYMRVGYGNVYAHTFQFPTLEEREATHCSSFWCGVRMALARSLSWGPIIVSVTVTTKDMPASTPQQDLETMKEEVSKKVSDALIDFIAHVGQMNLSSGVQWAPLTPELMSTMQYFHPLRVTIDYSNERAYFQPDTNGGEIVISPDQLAHKRSDILLHELAHYCDDLLVWASPTYAHELDLAYKNTLKTMGLYAVHESSSYVSADYTTKQVVESVLDLDLAILPPDMMLRAATAEPWSFHGRELAGMSFTVLLDPRYVVRDQGILRWSEEVQAWYVALYKPLQAHAKYASTTVRV